MTVTNQLKSKLKDLRPLIVKNAKSLLGTGTLNTKHQDALRQLKSKVASYQAKVRSLHRALFDLLDDEEHLQMLHLTRIYAQQQLLLGAGAEAADGVGGAGLVAVDADRDDEVCVCVCLAGVCVCMCVCMYRGMEQEVEVDWRSLPPQITMTTNTDTNIITGGGAAGVFPQRLLRAGGQVGARQGGHEQHGCVQQCEEGFDGTDDAPPRVSIDWTDPPERR
jgi:hypothetical protein